MTHTWKLPSLSLTQSNRHHVWGAGHVLGLLSVLHLHELNSPRKRPRDAPVLQRQGLGRLGQPLTQSPSARARQLGSELWGVVYHSVSSGRSELGWWWWWGGDARVDSDLRCAVASYGSHVSAFIVLPSRDNSPSPQHISGGSRQPPVRTPVVACAGTGPAVQQEREEACQGPLSNFRCCLRAWWQAWPGGEEPVSVCQPPSLEWHLRGSATPTTTSAISLTLPANFTHL